MTHATFVNPHRQTSTNPIHVDLCSFVVRCYRVCRRFAADHGAELLAADGPFDVAIVAVVEHQDWQIVFHAVGDCRGVHHAQLLLADLLVGKLSVEYGMGVFLGIVAVDALDAGRLHQDVSPQFQSFLGGGRVGRDKRGARATGQDNDSPFFQMPSGPTTNKRLGHAIHLDRRHQPRFAAERFERILQCQPIDDRGEHAHVVGCCFLDAAVSGGELSAAEDVAATDHNRNLYALLRGAIGLRRDVHNLLHTDAPFTLGSKALAGKFEHQPFVRPGGWS